MPECLLLIKVKQRTFESTLAVSQLIAALSTHTRQPTHPQTFNESFYQCHLIPQKVKVASVERGVVVSERKVPAAPRIWKPGIKTTFPPAGCKLQSYVACWCICWRDEWTHFKRSNYSQASKHTLVWGEKERFWQRTPSLVTFKKHKQECALYRNVFTGKWQKTKKNPKYQQWHSQQRSVCATLHFGNEKQRHMVTQLAAFANKCRWHIAPSGKENLMKAALL